ncbi:uncharacterized protein LOC101857760 [Aplysia californica]|uniref:Uncharacterized protein LOC101857760 n=1 Tax=Aplysia californica TaxID=6500 RepID=A0ABM1VYF6_APLCA|nr:uncharacterized protein LOC101857760 [Aplysia californica]
MMPLWARCGLQEREHRLATRQDETDDSGGEEFVNSGQNSGVDKLREGKGQGQASRKDGSEGGRGKQGDGLEEESGNAQIAGGGGGGGGSFEGIVRNVANLLSDTFLGYFRSTQKTPPAPSSLSQLDSTATANSDDEETITSLTSSPSSSSLTPTEKSQHESSTLATDRSQAAVSECSDTDADSLIILADTDSIQSGSLQSTGSKEQKSPGLPRDIEEILTSTLGALYGRATPAAVQQAWDVLSECYDGDGRRFKHEYLEPVLGLLQRLQEIQAVHSECPTNTWPLSVGSSVVVHLSRRNCRYLRDIGDFCVCAVVADRSQPNSARLVSADCGAADGRHPGASSPEASSSSSSDDNSSPPLEPRLLLCDLTFDGLVERRVDEREFAAVLTMDWARRVRDAPDHELSLVLRQCMVASEYTVRHLRWDDLPQFDPGKQGVVGDNLNRNNSGSTQSKTGDRREPSSPTSTQPDTTEGRELAGLTGTNKTLQGYSAQRKDVGVPLPDSTVDESSTDPPTPHATLSPPSAVGVKTPAAPKEHDLGYDLTFHTCPNSPASPQYSSSPKSPSTCSPTSSIALSNQNASTDTVHQSSPNPSSPLCFPREDSSSSSPPRGAAQQQHDSSLLSSSSPPLSASPPRNDPRPEIPAKSPTSSPAPPDSPQPSLPPRCPQQSSPSPSGHSPSSVSSSSSPSSSSPSPSQPPNVYGTWHGRGGKDSAHRRTPQSATPRAPMDSSSSHNSSGAPDNTYATLGVKHSRQHSSASCSSQHDSGVENPAPMQRTVSSSYLVRRRLPVPASVADVDNELLHSGVAILPGCRDEDRRSLVYIFTCSSLWQERRVRSTELAELLIYYHTVPRKCQSGKGLAVVADIRGSTTSTINILLEALYLFQDNVPEGISIVHLFADRATQSYVIKSPLYDSKASVNLKLVLSFDHLQQYVSPDQIPTVLDGHFSYNHESWVRFRKKLEPFMSSCRAVACRLVDVLQELSAGDQMPRSVAESAAMMASHEKAVKATFEDERLLAVQSDGPAVISSLKREQDSFAHSEDYWFAMEQASNLHQYLQDTISRLARLADSRLTKLHNCLQLREYEDECHKVISWLSEDGGSILQRYQVTADNLRAVRHQQKDFEKFYFSAMSYIEKGNDLLEEASMLSQCGNFSEATGYKDLSKTLKRQLQVFTGQLEDAREKIEGTARCYHLLDKSYEWALEAMKYVSSMRMEHSATAEGLDKLLRSLNVYLAEHPPVSEENFAAMLDAAQRLHNEKLLEQCRVAKARCQETHQLLQLRQTTLRRARNQMEVEQALKEGDSEASSRCSTHSTPAAPSSPSVFDVHEMAKPIAHISEDIHSDYRDMVHSSSSSSSPHHRLEQSSSVFTTPPSFSFERTPMDSVSSSSSSSMSSSALRGGGDGEDGEGRSFWEPKDSSTPTGGFTNMQQGGGDGESVGGSEAGSDSSSTKPCPRAGKQYGFRSEESHPSHNSSSSGRVCGEGASDSSGASTPEFRSPMVPVSPQHRHNVRAVRDRMAVQQPLHSSGGPQMSSSLSPSHILPPSPMTMPPPLSPASSSSSSSASSSTTVPHYAPLTDTPPSSSPRPRLYEPSPSSSPISRLYNSSPTRSSATSVARGSAAGKLALGRTISQPPNVSPSHQGVTSPRPLHSLPSGLPPASSRPLKKILKRASTAPIPMLGSPILEEDPQQLMTASFGSPGGGREGEDNEGGRQERSAKSLSMITGSSESLPSMAEEDESQLDASPSHEGQEGDRASTGNIRDWTPIPVNTHLHRSAQSTPTGPMADLRLSEAEMKSRRTVSLIMSEMIQTERDYVRALQFITDHYVPELQREDVPQMLRGKRTVIFGNLEKIQQFHGQYFLRHLEACQNQPFLVGQYFLQHETMFYLYALYNKNKPKSDTLMMEFGKDFFREKQLELGDKMDLSSYLLKPVQRMGKYALLLKQLLKECNETEPEYPELRAAEEMVKFQLRHGNDLLAMDSLRDCDVNLQEQGRLLRQEEFLVFQGRKKSMRRIFLFEDLILFSKTRRGRQGQHDIYVYKNSFKTADIGMTENFGDSGYKFEIWFRRRTIGDNYILQAPNSEVKKAWVKDISRILWRQAIRNRESRINELATMGIGNKPCLDIKPSEDNIQDRSINVSLGNRGARTRNSIAVSSFDYLRNGNKRPHSIISVSSTSSSGSSQSSFGLLGSLNLAFDPLDSPRLNRRSFISSESGIVTDGDTSVGDVGSENRGPSPRRASQGAPPSSAMRSYFDVMKSRVLKQKFSDQVYTDV